jgi:hypothetical protein
MGHSACMSERRTTGDWRRLGRRGPETPLGRQVREAAPRYSAVRDSAESPGQESPPLPDSPHLDDLAELAGLSDDDFIHELGSRIVRLAAHSAALEYRLLVLIAEFDRREAWAAEGYRDCADWLEMYTGMSRVTARERVRMARKLTELPQISESMSRGELSYSQVRALVRVATPENEAELLPMAAESTAGRLEKEVAHYRELAEWGDLDAERRRHAKRHLRVHSLPCGMVEVRGTVPPEVGALLLKVLDAAGDALFHSDIEWSPEAGDWGLATREISPGQRRADALHLVLERAMVAGFGVGAGEGDGAPGADAAGGDPGPGSDPGSAPAPTSASAAPSTHAIPSPSAERYTVMVHVNEATLTHDAPGRCDLEGELAIPPETARRLACDGAVVRVVRGPAGEVLDVGRKTRVVPPAIRRALLVRDGGCAFPGCGSRFAEAHHIVPWAKGGETKLDNLVLLCRVHHRGVHEGGFSVRLGRHGRPEFLNAHGVRLPDRPPPPALAAFAARDPVGHLVRIHRFRGIDPDAWTGACRSRPSPASRHRFQAALDPSG